MKSDTQTLPSFPAKITDPRYRWYRKLYGTKARELDAVDPGDLRERVARRIEKYIDRDARGRHKLIEEAHRRTTRMVLAQLKEGGNLAEERNER